MALETFGESLWIADGDRIRMLGIPFTTRMTVARLSDGGLAERVDLRFDHELGDEAEACWAADLDQLLFAGSKILNRKSKTLPGAGILQHHEPEADGWLWRTLERLDGIGAPEGGAPRDWRLTVREREAARRARDRMLSWGFERLVIAHGRCREAGVHAHVRRAFGWLD